MPQHYDVGCNTLYPFGRLPSDPGVFDLDAHRRALEIIAEAGGEGCEFSHYQHLSSAECEQLQEICGRLNVRPWSAHSWVALPTQVGHVDERVAGLKASIAGAAALGVTVMVVHAGSFGGGAPGPHVFRERRDALARALAALSPVADAAGLCLGIENCADQTDLDFLVETVAELDLPAVGFNVDTGHAVLHGMAPADVIRVMGKRLVTTHLQDNFGQRDDHLPPGKGTIAWPPVMSALREVGYAGMLMIEISDCPPGREPDAERDTADAVRFVRELQAHAA